MLVREFTGRRWSDFSWRVIVISVVVTGALSLIDGYVYVALSAGGSVRSFTLLSMAKIWVTDFRILFEQLILAGAVLFIGSKFFENRTLLTVGFDSLDADRISVKGPDDDHVVWIGQRYKSKFEAEVVANAISSRLEKPET